jgi:hypothetical protein
MFWIIARYHARLLVRERIIGTALVLLTLAMAYSFVAGHHRLVQERAAEGVFKQRAQEVLTRNQRLALAIEQRIAAGLEQERIPLPFGSRHPCTWRVGAAYPRFFRHLR